MYSLTKEQLRQLTDPKVKEWFPEVFNLSKDFTGWVKTKGELNKKWICYYENGFQKYGICADGNWFTQNIKVRIHGNEFEATEQEVFKALKNEAVKRGFEDGVYFSDNTGDNKILRGFFYYNSMCLYFGGANIFDNGVWATIIQTITKSKAEKLLNKKIID